MRFRATHFSAKSDLRGSRTAVRGSSAVGPSSTSERCAYRRMSQNWWSGPESFSARATLSIRKWQKNVDSEPCHGRESDASGPAPLRIGAPERVLRIVNSKSRNDAAVVPHFQLQRDRKASNFDYNRYHKPRCSTRGLFTCVIFRALLSSPFLRYFTRQTLWNCLLSSAVENI